MLGATERDRPSDTAREHRGQGAAFPELLLAEPVDHQEHDLVGPGHRAGEPPRQRGAARVGQLTEQGGHHAVEARALPVGQERLGPVSGLRSPSRGG